MPPSADRFFWPATGSFAAIILGLLAFGGAFTAEFSGAADEPAHFVTSLMVRDYIGLWPLPPPKPWAVQYYIHYPKVAFGHWPPGYYVLQSAWWLLFPPGRVSAMLLNGVLALAATLLFYVLARRIRPGWPALLAPVLFLFAPVTQQAIATTMAELPCLLCALLTLWSLTRLLEQPRGRYLAGAIFSLGAAFLMKGTGVALVPGFLLAIAVSGVWRRVRLPPALVIGILLFAVLPAGAWLLWQSGASPGRTQLSAWAGLNRRIPWNIEILPALAGAGFLALAAGGAAVGFWRRQPVALAAAAMLTGFVFTTFFVRAMREHRLWIAALPLILLLALAAYAWLEQRSQWAPLAFAAIALPLFPFQFYRQQPLGFTALAEQLSLPERMLISSPAGWSEGCWVAVVALGEKRPSSTIVRATKVLVRTDWAAVHYEHLAVTPAEIERKLDENGLNIVVLHSAVTPDPMPHHQLLAHAMRISASWRKCGEAGEVMAYCRTGPYRFPPKPVRIDLRQHIGEVIEEAPAPVQR